MSRAAAALDPTTRLHRLVLDWYAANARDLPWRRTRDPYAILVAEVMLQQTQVDRVIPKWHAWLARFPTLADLAAASRADAIRAWQGLGYNLRAVWLHRIACQAVADFGGQLPRTLPELLRLHGVGRYTAGAVACFAYELPVAMVDTNIRRVLGRIFDVAEPDQALADRVLPPGAAYPWNQALMDIGATLCRPDRPLCLLCPAQPVCASAGRAIERRPRRRAAISFTSSDRFIRGRVVDQVRALEAGAFISLAEVTARIGAEPARVERLVQQLAAEGLISFDPHRGVGVPL